MTSKHVDESIALLPFLFQQWPEVKRTKVRQWLRFGGVHINNHVVTQHDRVLAPGDIVNIRPQKAPPTSKALPAGLSIIYEDTSLLVVHKPINLLTVATETEQHKTVFRIMTNYLRESNKFSKERLWVVHRLDRETSGLLVMAKTEKAKIWLQHNWMWMEKRYLAVVEGTLPTAKGTLTGYIDESQPHRVFAAKHAASGARAATTHYQVKRTSKTRSLLEMTLETGRRHQIRVQLAAAGCPIVGDKKYGAKTNPIKRIALHAHSLRLLHPETEHELLLQSTLPAEVAQLLPSKNQQNKVP